MVFKCLCEWPPSDEGSHLSKLHFSCNKGERWTKKPINPLKLVYHPVSCLLHHYTHIYCKKVSLIAYRQILPKILHVVLIFSFTIMAYFEKFVGIKSYSTKQCPAELSPWIIPPVLLILPKMFPLLSSCLLPLQSMDCPTLHLQGKACTWGENPTQEQKNAYFPHQKNPPPQIAIFMYSPNTSFIYSCSHCCCIIFF